MKRRLAIPTLGGARAVILHRPHATVQALVRQAAAIGLAVETAWPDLPADAASADFIFFDADLGHDEQFPWPPGAAPMPLIALIGSEAPGRIEWALSRGAQAQLMKPIGDAGVYSALLIARQSFDAGRALMDEIGDLKRRLAGRQTVVQAVTLLAARGAGEHAAYGELRQLAMRWRVTVEEAAERIVARMGDRGAGHDRSGRS